MTPCDISLWGYLKSKVFFSPQQDMQDLRNRIQVELKNLRQNPSVIAMLLEVWKKGHEFVLKNMAGIKIE